MDKARKSTNMNADTSGGTNSTKAVLPPEVQNQINAQLRQVYGKLLAEPLPDKFSRLLDQLSKQDTSK
jgi:hypothetical protein